jgi:hypothetical protein
LFREAFRLEICAPPRLRAFRLGNRMPQGFLWMSIHDENEYSKRFALK